MKTITSWKLVVLSAFVGAVVFFGMADKEVVTQSLKHESLDVQLATSTLPVAVSGVVEAVNTTSIYARAAGIVTAIPYKEGSVVSHGMVLAVQDMLVEDANLALAYAEGALEKAERAVQISRQEANRNSAVVRAYSAAELATLRAESNENRLSETTAETAAIVNASVPIILAALDYINNNRTLFTVDGINLHTEALRLTYGSRVSYFDTSFLIGGRVLDQTALLSLSEKAHTSPVSAQIAVGMTAEVLGLIDEALSTAEKDVFDRVGGEDDRGTEVYLAQKREVAVALSNLEVARGSVAQVIDSALEDALAQRTEVAVVDIDRVEAERQATLVMEIASRAQGVSDAAISVATAQRSLGVTKAPFSGVVSKVLVEEGEYVVPGTPLLRFVGTGARELVVTIPDVMVGSLGVGLPFVVDGEVVGVVDRFSPVSEGRGHTVVITLVEEVASIGASLKGHVFVEPKSGVYKVPRAYVHFASSGPSITYAADERVSIEIIYDAGDELFIKVDRFKDAPLTPAIMITY